MVGEKKTHHSAQSVDSGAVGGSRLAAVKFLCKEDARGYPGESFEVNAAFPDCWSRRNGTLLA